MSEQHPPPLDYARPGGTPPPIPSGGAGRFLLLGLAAGSVVSAITWILGWNALVNRGNGAALFIVPGIKVLAAIVLLCFRAPQYRPGRFFGLGLLLSIAVGFLIFFGSCFAHI
jgi:hypothetical protein